MHWRDGVELKGSVVSFKLVGNWFHDNSESGLQVNSGVVIDGVLTIEGNLFKENTGPGIQNDSGSVIDATYNSWGQITLVLRLARAMASAANVEYTPVELRGSLHGCGTGYGSPGEKLCAETQTFQVKLKVDAQRIYGLSFKFHLGYHPPVSRRHPGLYCSLGWQL